MPRARTWIADKTIALRWMSDGSKILMNLSVRMPNSPRGNRRTIQWEGDQEDAQALIDRLIWTLEKSKQEPKP